jgi:hypothetical protein
MAHYVVETYMSRLSPQALDETVAMARRAAEEAPDSGVRHVRSVFLAEDEMCFHIFEAPSIDAVRHVSERAGIVSERIGLSLLSETRG